MFENTNLIYPILLIKSTAKRSFEALGKMIGKSGDTIARLLPSSQTSKDILEAIAKSMFLKSRNLTLAIDDTLLEKIYSQIMVGSGKFYDSKTGKKITAFRIIVATITDGTNIIPINFGFIFDKDLLEKNQATKSKLDFVKEFYKQATDLFPNTNIKIAIDGLYATVDILTWCIEYKIQIDTRMHSNRKVLHKGKYYKIREIACLIPVGRQMYKTITAEWHNLKLFITAERRIDKHGVESIVYIASTYSALPKHHGLAYEKRWTIEEMFRTTKQYLGLKECFSRKLDVQNKHIFSVFVAYSFAQLEMKANKYKNPEVALKAIKNKNDSGLKSIELRFNRIFGAVHA